MASSSNLISALGAGSGVDVKSLAEGLVEAERAPRKERIQAKLEQSEARISGYGALKYAISDFRAAVEKLNDASDFGTPKVANSQTAALGVVATGATKPGNYTLEVTQLARAQRSASTGFAAIKSATQDVKLNGGNTFDLTLSVNGAAAETITVPAGADHPQGIVDAINASGKGLSAQLIRTGDGATPYSIVVTGQEGAAKNFTLSSPDVAAVRFGDPLVQAADAELVVNGLPVTRSSNTVTDLIPDVTLNLYAPTNGEARVDFSQDTATVKDNIKGLVKAYNDLDQALKILSDPKSEVEDLGGSLAGDSLVRTVRNQIRSVLTTDSSTPGSTLKAARDMGLSFDRNGALTLDEARLDKALTSNYSDVVQILSAGTNNKSVYSTSSAGLAGDLVVTLDKMTRTTGLVARQTDFASNSVSQYKAQLQALEDRMSKLMERYTRQFSVMESLVGSTKELKNGLASSFEGMMAAYTN